VKTLEGLLVDVRACRVCAAELPLGPRPILQVSSTARLLIASQAPGTKAHKSGVPFSDASGDRLRDWLKMSPEQFYDPAQVAILPMGLCYPGRSRTGGDAPPRPECAWTWRARLLDAMPALRFTLVIGMHAQIYIFGRGSMTPARRPIAGRDVQGRAGSAPRADDHSLHADDRAPDVVCDPPHPRHGALAAMSQHPGHLLDAGRKAALHIWQRDDANRRVKGLHEHRQHDGDSDQPAMANDTCVGNSVP
jgi:uracil-DNA glycosylase